MTRGEPQSSEDAVATDLGAQHGLGTCLRVLRARRSPVWPLIGAVLGILAFASIQVLASTGRLGSPYAVLGIACLFIVLFVLTARRISPAKMDRVFWYTDGLAQVIDGRPEPRVVRWDEATSVTAAVGLTGESTRVETCTVRTDAGAEVTVDEHYGPSTPRDFLREAARVLAPRLVPPLIRTYDAGKPVLLGSTMVDRSGIATSQGKTAFTTWGEMRHIDGYVGNIVPEITIRTAKLLAQSIRLTGEPNCIFVFDLVRHAAAQNGVPFRDIVLASAPGLGAGWSAGRT